MDAVARALRTTKEHAAYFVAVSKYRALLLRVDATTRNPVLDLVRGMEWSADNACPFIELDLLLDGGPPSWGDLAAAVRTRHAAIAHDGGMAGPALVAPTSVEGPAALALTVRDAVTCATSATPPHPGLICVLATKQTHGAEELGLQLLSLVEAPSLGSVRWIIVEEGEGITRRFTERLSSDQMLASDVRADESAMRDAIRHRMIAASSAGEDVPGAAQAGGVWPPRVVPPPRVDRPAPPKDLPPDVAAARNAALAHSLLGKTVLQAALAAGEGRNADAIRLQTGARDQAAELPNVSALLKMELVLGALQAAASEADGGGPSTALRTFSRAQVAAERAELIGDAALAALAQGNLGLADKKPEAAFRAFQRAGELALQARQPILAIEAYRAAGAVAWSVGAHGPAAIVYDTALLAVRDLSPDERRASSGALVARARAAALRDGDRSEDAAVLDALADALETGEWDERCDPILAGA